jgi:hypothetical protein
VFANAPRYVRVSLSLDPRDMPFDLQVVLGEGQTSWPESDWNGVALWRLAKVPQARLAAITSPDVLAAEFARLPTLLRAYAGDFLGGNLQPFRAERAAQSRDRQPYQIWSPDATGRYTARAEPESAALKERFSRLE